MKRIEEVIQYLEKELEITRLENLEIGPNDSNREINYKLTQLGKQISYEKMLSFINDTHNPNLAPRIKSTKASKNDGRKPIIVCN